jgi:hypothetical protein
VQTNTDFCIDQQFHFRVDKPVQAKKTNKLYYAIDDIETGSKNEIPLWIFGFLY